MPTYDVTQYELHTSVHRVTANNRAEAIKLVLTGKTHITDNSTELVEIPDDYGMEVTEERYPGLLNELRAARVGLDDGRLPTICDIEVVNVAVDPTYSAGDRFRLIEDTRDHDEDDNERVTPAGSVITVGEVLTKSEAPHLFYYSVACHETGGWFFFDEDELAELPRVVDESSQ